MSAPNLPARYQELVRALVDADQPPVSEYWLEGAKQFYGGTQLERYECVGRGGDKTRDIVRSAVVETLYGEHEVPTTERHYFVIVTENLAEGAKTMRQLQATLRILKVKFDATADTIELQSTNRGIRVLACRVGAVSGFRCFGWAADEISKWRGDDGANPAREVVSSIRAMTVTHPHARGRMYSSPLAAHGYFHDSWTQGNSDRVMCRQAPTWVANPSVTEERTHELEPDLRIWAREYAAIPQSAALACFDADAVSRAFESQLKYGHRVIARAIVSDASDGKKDAFTWAVVEIIEQDDRRLVCISRIDGLEGRFYAQESQDKTLDRIAALAKAEGITEIHGDQRNAPGLESGFRARGLRFHEHTWTGTSKPMAVTRVRQWLRDGLLVLQNHKKLRAELLAFEEKLTPSGQFTFGGRGSHDDYVALIVTTALADIAGSLRATRPRGGNAAPPVRMPSFEDRAIGHYDIDSRNTANQDGQPDPRFSESVRQIFNKGQS